MIVGLAVAQVGLVIAAQLSVSHVAREVGRVVALDPEIGIETVVETAHTFGTTPTIVIEQRAAANGLVLIEVYVEGKVPSVLPGAPRTVSERLVVHRLE